ncbi:mucin-5AC-like isoform X1 [Centruroides sculpturatus]|uniref:mucin-5AC-like isoform X1 n=1 Tax=Centruroides sculpturatus TaxID=218467 RepID=UPI000C6E70B6|nr:mucin-5AC-like isoform X1 [Centruroides sculpturatus]
MNILTYDYHTAYEPETHHHAPLFPRPGTSQWEDDKKLTVEWTVDYYIQLGAPKDKIMMGIPTYGRSYTLLDVKDNELDAPTDGPGETGPATREKGYLAYYEICQFIKDDGWIVEAPHPKEMGPYAYKGNQWVGFDDEEMVAEKARYILDRGLGGAMIWTLDNDDFRGLCSGERSPLITALRSALFSNTIQGSSSQRSVSRSGSYVTPLPVHFDDETEEEEEEEEEVTQPPVKSRRPSLRRLGASSKNRNRLQTPAPPPTPDPGPTFSCPDEGFYNNPKDCRKYFWCLDSGPANLGVVPHAFTCPSGLFFNSKMEACDYPENVVCNVKTPTPAPTKPARPVRTRTRTRQRIRSTTPIPRTTTTSEPETTTKEQAKPRVNSRKPSGSDDVAELLRLIQSIGGVEKLQTIIGSKEKGESRKARQDDATTHFVPDYVTPRRSGASATTSETTTTTLATPSTSLSARPPQSYIPVYSPPPYRPATLEQPNGQQEESVQQQVPRRPQFDAKQEGPLFQYVEPPRARKVDKDASNYPFVYQMPDRSRDSTETVPEDATKVTEGPFSYQAPNRETTRAPEIVSEKPASHEDPNSYRVPLRVQVGKVVRIQNGDGNGGGGGGRRRTRVRVRTGSRHAAANVRNEEIADEAITSITQTPLEVVAVNGGGRIGVRRRPVTNNGYENAQTVRLVARRPNGVRQQALNGNGKHSGEFEYIAVRRIPADSVVVIENPVVTEAPVFTTSAATTTTLAPTTTAATTTTTTTEATTTLAPFTERFTTSIPTTTDFPTTRSSIRRFRPGYQPPIYQPPLSVPSIDDETTETVQQVQPQREVPITGYVPPITTTTIIPPPRSSGRRRTNGRRPTTARPITTTRRPTTTTTRRPRTTPSTADDVEPLTITSSGGVECNKRGIYRHPDDCSRFVVCAPSSRSSTGFKGRMLNCPASQIFLEDIGRCMKGDKGTCVKTRK